MHEFMNCKRVAELIKKFRRTIQIWVSMFNEDGLEAIIPNTPPGRPSSLIKEQKEALKVDKLTHPRVLGYECSYLEGKIVAHHIKQKFSVELSIR